MTSDLKRKRGPVDVMDAPKRTKSLKSQNGNPTSKTIGTKAGQNAEVDPPTKYGHTNGVKERAAKLNGRMGSPESIDFADMLNGSTGEHEPEVKEERLQVLELMNQEQHNQPKSVNKMGEKRSKTSKKKAPGVIALKETKAWKLSQPIGGRMIDADPIFSPDEKFLIVASRTAVHVYATATSLLTRSIPLGLKADVQKTPRIITLSLSLTNPELLWVACSDGTIFKVDWTTGAGADSFWTISSTGCLHMTVASIESAGRKRDVVFTTEARKDGGFRITANELYSPDHSLKTDARTIYMSPTRIQFLKSVNNGSVIAAASGNSVLIGRLRSPDFGTIDNIRYEFRSFESKDLVKSMDLRVSTSARITTTGKAKKATGQLPVVDVVVGDVRGAIFVHHDLPAKLFSQKDGVPAQGMSLVPKKLHWHRKVVQTVKWSMDGNYVISGGTETVLVLWQLDTGKQQFLPHMAATIQNLVVSPTGTSYAVQLADNSAMVLSTADLEPRTNIAGIQASAVETQVPLESEIAQINDTPWPASLIQRTPAVISLTTPSHLLLAVGQVQEVRAEKPLVMSNPFLQTFDLGTNHSISTQALARTNITNLNTAPNAHRLVEPRILHMKLSYDGQWLVTVDEWTPPERDIKFLDHWRKDGSLEQQHRREVFLKFWQWNKQNGNWELVSRIDAPHSSYEGAARILDLVADPTSLRFATIGSDNVVRTWSTKSRKQDGLVLKGKDNSTLVNWHCAHAITLSKPELCDNLNNFSPPSRTGCLSFSEDGSVLAAVHGGQDVPIHLIDPTTGSIRTSLGGLVENEIFGLEFLGPDLVILSDNVVVYDLVAEHVKTSFRLSRSTFGMSVQQKTEMFHLAVDPNSSTFAIALPWIKKTGTAHDSLLSGNSELLVFSPDRLGPQLCHRFPSLITALLPTTSSLGYLVLDAAAEIHTVLVAGSSTITALAQSTSAQGLDDAPPAPTILPQLEDVESEGEELPEEDYEPLTPDATQDGHDDDEDAEFPVVTQQQLSEVFDIGPAYAMPPMEEMFLRVAELFSGKALPIR